MGNDWEGTWYWGRKAKLFYASAVVIGLNLYLGTITTPDAVVGWVGGLMLWLLGISIEDAGLKAGKK